MIRIAILCTSHINFVGVLVVQNNIKQPQIDLYNAMKRVTETTKTPLMVAFNRVDESFNPNTRGIYLEPSYFPDLKKKASSKLKCNIEDIFFVALSPARNEEFEELKTVGVLDYDAFKKEVHRRVEVVLKRH